MLGERKSIAARQSYLILGEKGPVTLYGGALQLLQGILVLPLR
jgi:hypothetical protein